MRMIDWHEVISNVLLLMLLCSAFCLGLTIAANYERQRAVSAGVAHYEVDSHGNTSFHYGAAR